MTGRGRPRVVRAATAHLDHPTAQALATDVLAGPRRRAVLWITHTGVGLDLVDRVVELGDDWPAARRSPAWAEEPER